MKPRFGQSDPGLTGAGFVAAQSFLLEAKMRWTKDMFPALRAAFDAAESRGDGKAVTADDVDRLIGTNPTHQIYAWMERHLQRFKYSGRYGLHAYYDAQRQALEDALPLPDGDLLTLNPDVTLPAYYTAVDIHQHPGGVWSDKIAGYVYERGARTTTPTLGAKHEDLHTRFTDLIASRVGEEPKAVFDMACGFGKSTQPFCDVFRSAQVTAMDLSEPCLRLAAKMAKDAQIRNVRYIQRDATECGLPEESQDIVTSTMFLHEMPPVHVEKALVEAFRVLQPGGTMAHLDFHHLPDAFARFVHYGHGRRNNEPYMRPLAEMDLAGLLERIGFDSISIEPFEEADGALAPENTVWRFPWTVISARKPGG